MLIDSETLRRAPKSSPKLIPRSTDWIEIDYNYERDLKQKKAVIEEHGSKVLTSMPENDAASGELLETLIDYLPKVSSSSPSSSTSANFTHRGTPRCSRTSPAGSGTRSPTSASPRPSR